MVGSGVGVDVDAEGSERDWIGSGSMRGSFDSGGECGVAYGEGSHLYTPLTSCRDPFLYAD